ncbi:hypothetical protein EST38_g1634 [Candolleomyces aberdarensis]|uniref:Uncharacterized protein n=1 Tax=Candolleomyces aberdarensis TaxID=2316362 RepID=A0A4Q2DWZ4_9AGAR|nr:hypothetical protein EST38_g1634 [Candolleomyces aberdarensis]
MSATGEVELREQLAAQERESERLKSIIRLLGSSSKDVKADEGEEEHDVAPCSESDGENEPPAESSSDRDSEDATSDEEELLEAYWDEDDLIHRCAECNDTPFGTVVHKVTF